MLMQYRYGTRYALMRRCLLEQEVIFSANTRRYVIDPLIINIAEPLELEIARYLMPPPAV